MPFRGLGFVFNLGFRVWGFRVCVQFIGFRGLGFAFNLGFRGLGFVFELGFRVCVQFRV